jgi:hypothetical protein
LSMTRPPMTRSLWLEGTQRIYLSRFSLVDCYKDLDNVNKLVSSHFPIQFITISLWYKYHSIKSNSFLDLFLAHTSFQYGKNDRGKVLPTSITMGLENKFFFLQNPFGLNYVLERSLFWSSFLVFEIKLSLSMDQKVITLSTCVPQVTQTTLVGIQCLKNCVGIMFGLSTWNILCVYFPTTNVMVIW